ncbi:MAG: choice-of-anchor D domain-containing protein [Thioploca sp.]|nr:choice-of-anchor D domain-containing protein [Thioploca sp.]
MYPKSLRVNLIGLIISLFFLNTTLVFAKSFEGQIQCNTDSLSIPAGETQSSVITITDKPDFIIKNLNITITPANLNLSIQLNDQDIIVGSPISTMVNSPINNTWTLKITNNDTTAGTITGWCLNGGIQSPEYQSDPPSNATNAINVGEINVGQSVETTIKIQNIGSGSLIIKDPILNGDVNEVSILTSLSLTIAKGSTPQELKIKFKPQTHGTFTATLKLTTNDPDKSSVQYTFDYSGLAPPEYSSDPEPGQTIDFGEIEWLWGPGEYSLTVQNSGDLPLTINSLSIVGTDKNFLN